MTYRFILDKPKRLEKKVTNLDRIPNRSEMGFPVYCDCHLHFFDLYY